MTMPLPLVQNETQRMEGRILDWDVICLAEEGEKAKHISLSKLARRLFQRLDALWASHGPRLQYVLIENQPARLNGHMKSIQMMIYSYFMYKAYEEGDALEPLFVNATGKLKTHTEAMKHVPECKLENGYKKNKVVSVQVCDYYIREDEMLRQKLLKNKKKDDLCDAMLQAVGWFHKKYQRELSCVKSS